MTIMTQFIASTTQVAPSLADTVPYLVGMLLVIITLSTLWAACLICAKIVAIVSPPAKVISAPQGISAQAPATAKQQAAATGIAPEVVAVIAAAVASVAGRSHRIISIKENNASWGKAGRQSVLSSHRIR